MKTTLENRLLFYIHIGKLFYAVAAADRVVKEEEVAIIKKLVNTEWLHQFEEETEAMREIKIEFMRLLKENKNPQECLNTFKNYKLSNEIYFPEEVKQLLWKTAQSIATAFSGTNKSELILLTKLGVILRGE